MTTTLVLSYLQTNPLLAARLSGQPTAMLSSDLGLTQSEVRLSSSHVEFTDGRQVSWDQIEEVNATPAVCFMLEGGHLRKLQLFSEVTNRFCSLLPTSASPALLVAGFPMHRIKGTDPQRDTLTKIQAIAPVTGHVLDTATGLGYTAILAAHSAGAVITVELDPAVLVLARQNPWSQALFDNPRIVQRVGDTAEVIQEFEAGSFDRIVHDPPTLSLAGDLYSGEFYVELCRVLRKGGRLYHYLGDPSSHLGQRTGKGVRRRLLEAGFGRIRPAHAAFGLVAYK
jgi:predicted methyltransferase